MTKSTLSIVLLTSAALTGCINKATTTSASGQPIDTTVTSNAPVETNLPNTSYKPAFSGQTRIAGVRTTTPIAFNVVTSDLKKPWGIRQLPDGRFLVTEKAGVMRIVNSDGSISDAIKGIPEVNASGQGGLLGLVLDPAFKNNRLIYWTFAEKTDKGNTTSVAKGRLSNDEKTIENAVVIYRATPAYDGNLHYGSRIVFDRSGNLLLTTGERSDLETRPQAQSLSSALGKIIRITVDGKPAPGNPFASGANARPEIYSYGHRNPQGLTIHPQTGDIWSTEMGPRGGDELNKVVAGKNYGWPTITYGIEYSGEKIGNAQTQKEGMVQPIYYWDPVISPGGTTFYAGNAVPEWQNNIFIGGLSSQHIIRLVLDGDKVVGEERLLANEGQRFRDVTEGNDGALYAITDQGRLYRIGKK